MYVRAQEMRAAGVAFGEICRELGLPRSTLCNWFYGERARARAERPAARDGRCPFCTVPSRRVDDPGTYAYLLGQYLGDGHLLMTQRVPLFSVACDSTYPEIIAEIDAAMRACGARAVHHRRRHGCTIVAASWKHWPCLLPQHGPGKKHGRHIALTGWQQHIVDDHPGRFLRGLIHSDGCRVTNTVKRNGKVYTYPRYHFTNHSVDIMRLCQQSLDRLGIPGRMCSWKQLSVARREAVAALDVHVGPKS